MRRGEFELPLNTRTLHRVAFLSAWIESRRVSVSLASDVLIDTRLSPGCVAASQYMRLRLNAVKAASGGSDVLSDRKESDRIESDMAAFGGR